MTAGPGKYSGKVAKLDGSTSVRLDDLVAKAGGEGEVYLVKGHPELLAKIYAGQPPSIDKIKWLIGAGSSSSAGTFVAWPSSLIHLDRGSGAEYCGIAIPFIKDSLAVSDLLNPKQKLEELKRRKHSVDRKQMHEICRNFVAAVRDAHAGGVIFADLNPNNILVNPSDLTVGLIDIDSAVIAQGPHRDVKSSLTFPGGGNLAPELLSGKPGSPSFANLKSKDRTLATDSFTIGVYIFQLLLGNFPYAFRVISGQQRPDGLTENGLVLGGVFPYGPNKPPNVDPPINVDAFAKRSDLGRFDWLHPRLRQCFVDCFVHGHTDPSRRPSDDEWFQALDESIRDMTKCAKNHWFIGSVTPDCPWCGSGQHRPLKRTATTPTAKVRVGGGSAQTTPTAGASRVKVMTGSGFSGSSGQASSTSSTTTTGTAATRVQQGSTSSTTTTGTAPTRVQRASTSSQSSDSSRKRKLLVGAAAAVGVIVLAAQMGWLSGLTEGTTEIAQSGTQGSSSIPWMTSDSPNGGNSTYVIDGNVETTWRAEDTGAATWIQLDLGKVTEIEYVRWFISKGGSGATVQISVSSDNRRWTLNRKIVLEKEDIGQFRRRRLDATARFVRFQFSNWPERGVAAEVAELSILRPGESNQLEPDEEPTATSAGVGIVTTATSVPVSTATSFPASVATTRTFVAAPTATTRINVPAVTPTPTRPAPPRPTPTRAPPTSTSTATATVESDQEQEQPTIAPRKP